MAFTSSVGLDQGHTCCPARVARCFRGAACPYMLRGRCWFEHDALDGDPPCRDVAATSCRVDAATASGLLMRVRRLEHIVEQIGGVLLPQIKKRDVEGFQQNSVVEQIVGAPAPQTWEPLGEAVQLSPQERVQNCTQVQTMDSSMPQITEDGLPIVPHERVQNHTPEQIVDVLVPQITEERVQLRTQEQIVDVLVPQITEDSLPIVPQEREQNRTREQIVDVLVPQIAEESVQHRTPEQIVDVLVPQITEDSLPIVPQERVQNRTLEQIVDFPVPRIMEAIVEEVLSPQERVQNRTPEQLVDVPVPQIMEAIVENFFPEQLVDVPVPQILEAAVDYCFPEQTVNFPVSQNMEAYAGRVRATPQEGVQNRILEPVSTGKVFTVKLRHHCDDHASSDNVGFIKGLDKHNMPRFEDVMVPPPQIIKGFLGYVAADVPLYRFQAKRSGRSSRAKLKR